MVADSAEYSTPLDHETTASWRTTCSLLHCPSCAASTQSNQVSEILMQDTNQSSAGCGPLLCYPWLRNLQCSSCYEKWSVCIDCANVRKPPINALPRQHVDPGSGPSMGSPSQWFTRMPDSFQDMRHLYLEGKTSFIPNLPRPNVIRLQRHAYVSVIDCCIAEILVHGLDLDTINAGIAHGDNDTAAISQFPAYQKNSKSQHCREIYDRAQASILTNNEHHPLICLWWINEWSDGFESSYSVKAKNQGSTWLKTITISPPANKVHSLEYTYPIAVGRSSSPHEEVERLFADELRKRANNTEGQLFTMVPQNKVHSLEYTYPIAVGRSSSPHEEVETLFALQTS